MSPNNTYAATLLAATSYLTLSIDLITFVIGTTGSVCNLIIFTAPRLRRNACVFYLLCATVFQLITIIFIVPVRLASNNFGSNLDNQSIIYCKIRYYLAITLPESATYYILLSIMDRCLATSTNAGIRAWSNLKVAYRMSVGILIFIFIANIQLIVFFTIYNNSCQIKPDSFETFYGPSYILILAMIIPYTLMLILSLKTYFQMKKMKQRIAPVSNSSNHTQTSRFESQIIMIILLQIIVTSTLLLIRIVSYAYTIFTSDNFNKTLTERAIENFIVQSSSSLYFFSFAISFYVSTLTSKYFRDIFKKRIAHLYGHCRRQ
ncbi:unnamed protein product [Adineta steineri]|uniref:G-protein coupled receptors family 1 profile domain-containing protein n=1 Tax=Adineta steineri TaxID=433720 RepID=A0A814DKY3_9BILA|nr:unnamed protein product [Adineta steineri]CAF3902569.1 unnamed protein product [Adineta steineri]